MIGRQRWFSGEYGKEKQKLEREAYLLRDQERKKTIVTYTLPFLDSK